ncbi:MAG: hypothetical protein ACTSW1_05995 [Candidatus Hodarchaeales archaeon]
MKLDEKNPCPHCGSTEALTKKNIEVKPVIPKDLQYDFARDTQTSPGLYHPSVQKEIYETPFPKSSDLVGSLSELGIKQTPKRVSQNLPLESLFPDLKNVSLDPASLKVYFQLSIEFQIILDKALNYQEGMYRWNLLLPDRLQEYGLTLEAWEHISSLGDNDPVIQEQLNAIIKKIFG